MFVDLLLSALVLQPSVFAVAEDSPMENLMKKGVFVGTEDLKDKSILIPPLQTLVARNPKNCPAFFSSDFRRAPLVYSLHSLNHLPIFLLAV